MSDTVDKSYEPDELREQLKERFLKYLKTSFYFRDSALRESFSEALQSEQVPDQLVKGPINKYARSFKTGVDMKTLLERHFGEDHKGALPAFMTEHPLYRHQETAIEKAYSQENVVISTGTASGKTECFLYPVLMELYRQHIAGELDDVPGVRAMVLYPMNALANDQVDRLRNLCKKLVEAGSDFVPTFGKYTGETPEDNRFGRPRDALPNERLTRKEIRATPPHILLTNYSMLEYLLIRPLDCDLFDDNRGSTWKFIILDEAHVYRGTKGVEIGMLMRRLRHRLKLGGNKRVISIAASATLVRGDSHAARASVADYAGELFGEPFNDDCIIFESRDPDTELRLVNKNYFMRGLSGAYLTHVDGEDKIRLNNDGPYETEPIEIALCGECGQHYYVGKIKNGYLQEANRDYSSDEFGVQYFIPKPPDEIGEHETEHDSLHLLNRETGKIQACRTITKKEPEEIYVLECENHEKNLDCIKRCHACGNTANDDPVRELIHNHDDPNAIIATTLLQDSQDDKKKTLSFSDSRLSAAYFPVHMERFYRRLASRGLLYRTISETDNKISINDFIRRLKVKMEDEDAFGDKDLSEDDKFFRAAKIVMTEALTRDKRNSLSGVGLVKWSVMLPEDIAIPKVLLEVPWKLTEDEAKRLINYLIDTIRGARCVELDHELLSWSDIEDDQQPQPSMRFRSGWNRDEEIIRSWASDMRTTREQYLRQLLKNKNPGIHSRVIKMNVVRLLNDLWETITDSSISKDPTNLLYYDNALDAYRLKSKYVLCELIKDGMEELFKCRRCASVWPKMEGDRCPRHGCYGELKSIAEPECQELEHNYYRSMYNERLSWVRAEEHTAQLVKHRARLRQKEFEDGDIDILSSSTTFEMGVDLGDLGQVLMCNVPPEPYNYIQRAGRAGRRDKAGKVITYCGSGNHDKFHYIDPINTIMKPPDKLLPLKINNPYIIERHAVAEMFSSFFRESFKINKKYLKSLEELYSNQLGVPSVKERLKKHAVDNMGLRKTVLNITPPAVREDLHLNEEDANAWVERLIGDESNLNVNEQVLCAEYRKLQQLHAVAQSDVSRKKIESYRGRMQSIRKENAIAFLSRKAIIPKYGFPVDVVDLDLHICEHPASNNVQFSRDLSQAISEFAPGSGLVADKRDWRSYGIKTYADITLKERKYSYNEEHHFIVADKNDDVELDKIYLVPSMGFVVEQSYDPPFTRHRPSRQHSTRSYLMRYLKKPTNEDLTNYNGLIVIRPLPAEMATLCEGKGKRGFKVCLKCGCAKEDKYEGLGHSTPYGDPCDGQMMRCSFGHEFVTSVVQLRRVTTAWQFDDPGVYSLAYALMYGLADALKVPENDLNVTVIAGDKPKTQAILLYDNVPGGAGLVEKLMDREILMNVLDRARARVSGACKCKETMSCYSCLRSWRNQPFHEDLRRVDALRLLDELPQITTETMRSSSVGS